MKFIASAPRPFEDLLAQELRELAVSTNERHGTSIRFGGELADAYRVLMYSRVVSRLTMLLAEGQAESADDVYELARAVEWEQHLDLDQTLSVDFKGLGAGIRNTQYGARRVKDAIVDRLRELRSERPLVNTENPDVLVFARVARDGRIDLGIDLNGGGLHRRGYRAPGVIAPLKENVAAAVLMRMGFNDSGVLDPMCGSGTLLIEAALIAGRIAPGLLRPASMLERWPFHDRRSWTALREEARSRRRTPPGDFCGYDTDPTAVRAAQKSAELAGLAEVISIAQRDAREVRKNGFEGWVVSNLPYGERLEQNETQLRELYRTFGLHLAKEFASSRFGLLVASDGTSEHLPLRVEKRNMVLNGRIECWLIQGRCEWSGVADRTSAREAIANRLRKNKKRLAKWLRSESIECYRLYDADIPEYSVAIDVYKDWVHVQEYAPPPSVEPKKAEQRLDDVVAVIPEVLGTESERVVTKVRSRQRGRAQYEKRDARRERLQVVEGRVRLLVNLHDYLDTGLFLDHRPTRLRLAELCRGKRFLNLFSYTGAATVHAAKGGASRTVSVDQSNTYLEWAEDNLRNNGLEVGRNNHLVKSDVLKFLRDGEEEFDLIFCDPPTFSNSKSTVRTFDVQRDHRELIDATMRRLHRDGLLIFSTNRLRFRLDSSLLDAYSVAETTQTSIPRDFARHRRIHKSFEFRHLE